MPLPDLLRPRLERREQIRSILVLLLAPAAVFAQARQFQIGLSKDGELELIERREMPVCRTAGPEHWIVTFRANIVSPR